MLDWEIDNLTIKEMRVILQSDTTTEKNKVKWRGCWNQHKMREAIKLMRNDYKTNEKKSGIRFQTEASTDAEFNKFAKDIHIGNEDKVDQETRSLLLSLGLCQEPNSDTEKQGQNVGSGHTLMEENTAGKILSQIQETDKSSTIDLNIIQETTLDIEKNSMFSTDDSQLDMLTKAAKVTPMKSIAPKGKTSSKSKKKQVVGKNSRKGIAKTGKKSNDNKDDDSMIVETNREPRKSVRIENQNQVDYNEEEEMSVENVDQPGSICNITAATEDWEIKELNEEDARAMYKSCMQKRGVLIKEGDIAQCTLKQLIDNLFVARDQEREVEACIKDAEAAAMDEEEDNFQFTTQDDAVWNADEGMETDDRQTESKDMDMRVENAVDSRAQSQPVHETNCTEQHEMLTESESQVHGNAKMDTEQHTVNATDNKKEQESKDSIQEEATSKVFSQTQKSEWQQVTNKKGQDIQQEDEYKVPFTGLRGHPAQNLLGMTVNEFTLPQNTGDKNNEKITDVVTQEQTMYILRVNLETNSKATNHVPTFIKKFVRVLRHADATIKILPFDSKNKNANDIITDEKDLPTSENEIKKWAVGLRKTQYHKLEFSIRVEMTLSFPTLKDMIYDWCGKNACWVKFNNIDSEFIFRAGWIQGLHPIYHNRNKVREILSRSAPHLRDRISVYSRTVVQKNKDKTKTYCEALAVDGAFPEKREILKMLCAAQTLLTRSYPGARFFPFRRGQYLTADDQRIAMKRQNKYNDSTNMKDLTVENPKVKYKIVNKDVHYSFLEWIKHFQINGVVMFSHVEETDKGKIRVIYKAEKEPQVCELIAHLYQYTIESFGKEAAHALLGNEAVYMEKKEFYNVETTHEYQCAQYFRSQNKEEGKESSNRFGKKPSYAQVAKKPNKKTAVVVEDDQDDEESDSNTETTNNSIDNRAEEKIEELSQTVTMLQAQVEQAVKCSNDSTGKDQRIQELEKEIENQKKEFTSEINKVKEENSKNILKTEKKLVVLIEKKEAQITKQVEGMTAFIKTSLKTSEDNAVRREENQNRVNQRLLEILSPGEKPPYVTPNVGESNMRPYCGEAR